MTYDHTKKEIKRLLKWASSDARDAFLFVFWMKTEVSGEQHVLGAAGMTLDGLAVTYADWDTDVEVGTLDGYFGGFGRHAFCRGLTDKELKRLGFGEPELSEPVAA